MGRRPLAAGGQEQAALNTIPAGGGHLFARFAKGWPLFAATPILLSREMIKAAAIIGLVVISATFAYVRMLLERDRRM
jgi:hypothetical protein